MGPSRKDQPSSQEHDHERSGPGESKQPDELSASFARLLYKKLSCFSSLKSMTEKNLSQTKPTNTLAKPSKPPKTKQNFSSADPLLSSLRPKQLASAPLRGVSDQ